MLFHLFACISSFTVIWNQPAEASKARRTAERFIQMHDRDRDGKLSVAEFPARNRRLFAQIDSNGDGFITRDEDTQFRLTRLRNRPEQRRRGVKPTSTEHREDGVTIHRDLVYATVGSRKLPLDLYLPQRQPNESTVPVVVWIHGGGWKGGKKGNAGPAKPLVERGFAVVDVEYRLSGEAKFPAQIQDCKAAIRWLRAHADQYGLNPERIGIWGGSAGGHLAALVGTSTGIAEFKTASHSKYSSSVQAVCSWYGPTDLLAMDQHDIPGNLIHHDAADSPESQLVGGPIQKSPYRELAMQANPIVYVDKTDPPFLLMHGKQDLLVSYRQSEVLHQALQSKGVSSTLMIIEKAGHSFKNSTRNRRELAEEVFNFFEKHLKNKTANSRIPR